MTRPPSRALSFLWTGSQHVRRAARTIQSMSITIAKVNGGYEVKLMRGVPPIWLATRAAALVMIDAALLLNSRLH